MIFVELRVTNGPKISVNREHIVNVIDRGDNKCSIVTICGHMHEIDADYEYLMFKLTIA